MEIFVLSVMERVRLGLLGEAGESDVMEEKHELGGVMVSLQPMELVEDVWGLGEVKECSNCDWVVVSSAVCGHASSLLSDCISSPSSCRFSPSKSDEAVSEMTRIQCPLLDRHPAHRIAVKV